jgi:predicted  nucleic acid-binding Zn-ribbon protein
MGIATECKRCGYKWDCVSDKPRVTCYNCGTTIYLKHNISVDELKARAKKLNKAHNK